MDKYQVVYLTGAPATGKSTLAKRLQSKLSQVRIFSYGELLTQRLNQKHAASFSQSTIREKSGKIITDDDVRELDNELIDEIGRIRKESHVIIDSHPITKESYGFRAIPFASSTLQKISPTMIISLSANPEIIIQRIQKDAQGRPLISEHDALIHNYLQGSVATTYSIVLGIPVYFIDTDNSKEQIENIALKIIGTSD